MHKTHHRIYEIDLLRGVAVICMIIYHIIYDLNFFGVTQISMTSFFWVGFARIIQTIFIVTTGVTAVLATSRTRQIKHVSILFGIALCITFITWILFKDLSVKFGILHFLAVSIFLSIPLKKNGAYASLIGIFILIAGTFLSETSIPWLFPLGFVTPEFKSFDFFPLIPWFGLFLQGVAIGSYLQKKNWKETYKPFLVRSSVLEKIGQHTLSIYLIHQVVISGIIYLILWI